jgi:serine/threonine protein kinase/tetratricopeptide (TPR) repeat protein
MSETLPTASAPTMPLLLAKLGVGQLLAHRYEIVAPLGQGGMGAVYRVRDRELGEDIALKVLKPEIADVEGALDRFRREVKLARRVTHPNVARTYDLGHFEGIRYLTMELITGVPLSKRMHGRRMPLADVLRIAAEIARGLSAAHAAGVVHRDLKPDNVMIADVSGNARSTPQGASLIPSSDARFAGERIVLTDFGIARLTEGAPRDSSMQTVGIAVGTPAYMAPEQLEGRELDGRADIYAFGVLLFEILTGELPFKGDTIYALAAARLAGNVPDPRSIDPTIPEPIARLVRDSLARNRDDRPDAQRLLDRIDALRGSAVEVQARVPRLPSLFDVSQATPLGPRLVAILPFEAEGGGPDATRLAADLGAAVNDALAGVKGVRIVPATAVRNALVGRDPATVLDASQLGRGLRADLVLEGSVRVAGATARVRTHLVEVTSALQSWAKRFEAKVDDPFALEDDVVEGVGEAFRALGEGATRRGPSDEKVRALYEKGRAEYLQFGPTFVESAVESFRRALEMAPGDAWLLSALGAALTRLWILKGATDRELIAEAEELSLRALATDASIGETFATIGILRLQHGEMRAAVRAFHEALARSPLLAEAHGYLGRLLAESGHVEEALRRLDLSIRLEPDSLPAYWEKARTQALVGDLAGALRTVDQGVAIGGPMSGVYSRARFVMWYRDKDMARDVIQIVKQSGEPGALARVVMVPILEAFAEDRHLSSVIDLFRQFADEVSASPRQRSFFFQLSTEYYAVAGMKNEALTSLEKAAALPLIDLLWLDRCAALDSLRDDERFGRARAFVAMRVAELWS